MPRYDLVLTNARLATMEGEGFGIVEDAAVAIAGETIAFAGPMAALAPGEAGAVHDLDGMWVTPGLIDCHTHLVYGGNRSAEFEMRLAGASYVEIAAAGGGIRSTVAATRAASEEALFAGAAERLEGADGRGRHHGRDQVRLRARSRHRAPHAPRRAAARQVLPGDGGGDLSRRPHRACRACRGSRRLCRSRLRG